jgi:hypothetical protein
MNRTAKIAIQDSWPAVREMAATGIEARKTMGCAAALAA